MFRTSQIARKTFQSALREASGHITESMPRRPTPAAKRRSEEDGDPSRPRPQAAMAQPFSSSKQIGSVGRNRRCPPAGPASFRGAWRPRQFVAVVTSEATRIIQVVRFGTNCRSRRWTLRAGFDRPRGSRPNRRRRPEPVDHHPGRCSETNLLSSAIPASIAVNEKRRLPDRHRRRGTTGRRQRHQAKSAP